MANNANKIDDAFVEVHADTSKLPADLGKVPSVIRSLLSTNSLRNIGSLISGNFSGFVKNVVVSGYERAADQLYQAAEREKSSADSLSKGASAQKEKSQDKTLSDADRAESALQAKRLMGLAKEANERAKARTQQGRDMEEAGAQAGQTAGNIVRLTTVAIVAGVVATIKAIQTAAEATSANTRTDILVKATGQAAGWTADQLRRMGEELRKNSQFSNEEIRAAQQTLLAHPNIKGNEFKNALKMSSDLASAWGKELPAAAGDLAAVMDNQGMVAGDLLKKFGVDLNQQQVGFLNAKLAARDYTGYQQLILKYLDGFAGASEQAMETGIGGWNKLKASIQNAIEKIFDVKGGMGGLAAATAKAIDKTVDKWDTLKATVGIVWLQIKIGARTAVDFMVNGAQSIYAAFVSAFDAIGKGAEAMWDNMMNLFSDKPAKDIGAVMNKAFEDSMINFDKRFHFGEDSAAVKGMKAERDALIKERDEIEERRKKAMEEEMNPHPTPPPVNRQPQKFEFVGFEDMAKKIQQSIYPTEAEQFQRAGLAAAEKIVANGEAALPILGAIKDGVDKMGGFK